MTRLLEPDFPGRDQLLLQVPSVTACELDEDGGLALRCQSVELAPVKQRVPTEGECVDVDGMTIHILLHVVNGLLHELEIYKDDSSRVLRPPAAESISVFAP